MCYTGMCFVSFFVFTYYPIFFNEERGCVKMIGILLCRMNRFVLVELHLIPMNFAEPGDCMVYIGIPLTNLTLPLVCACPI